MYHFVPCKLQQYNKIQYTTLHYNTQYIIYLDLLEKPDKIDIYIYIFPKKNPQVVDFPCVKNHSKKIQMRIEGRDAICGKVDAVSDQLLR